MPRLSTLASLGVLALASCHTGGRLWRITPFEGGASDRVNLWPLAYHSGSETSVLWPLFDVDDRGFALRPLIAKDGPGYSILYPFASFDAEAGTGWIFPFYRFEGASGLFPLAHFGSLSFVGPWWWTERSSGLFPVAKFGGTSYVGPVWWGEETAGLFPLALFGSTSYVGPAWWTPGGESYGFFPLFGVGFLGATDHVGPVWWRSDPEEGLAAGLFPFVSYADGGRRFALFPLYSHDLRPGRRTRDLLLGLGHSARTEGRDERWLLPFYYHREAGEKRDTALLPFFWKRTRGDRAEVYTLLGNRSVDPGSETLNVYPLWWSNEGEESAWKMLFPFFYYGRDGDERTLITPLGGRGWSESGERAFLNVFGPLYHRSRSLRRDETRTAFLWPLFEWHERGEERTTRMAGVYSRKVTPERDEASYLFGLGHKEKTATGASHRLWPLYSWSDDEESPGPVYGLTLYGRERRGEAGEEWWLFPLASGERSPGRKAWNALLGLVQHEEIEGGEERFWVWPLYSRSTNTTRPSFGDYLSLVGSSRSEEREFFQVGASLLYSSSLEENERARRAKQRALLFFTHEEDEVLGGHVPAPGADRVQNRVAYESHGFLFDLFLKERSEYRVWEEGVLSPDEARALREHSVPKERSEAPDPEVMRSILAARGIEPSGADPESLQAAVEAFSAANTRVVERRKVRVPLVYGAERMEEESSWYGPLGLVSYEKDAEKEQFRLLYYGYRSETKGGRTSRDIFPFITLDTGPEEVSWSFLWRLLRYERKGGKRGGHVLFVPWGDL